LFSPFWEVLTRQTDLKIDLKLLADTFNTTKLINSVEFLIECAGLVELDEVDYFLFRNGKVTHC